jgi:hypothetical protein
MVARKIAGSLNPGGFLLTAHCNVLGDGPAEAGLDWDVPFGANGIGAVLAATPGLVLRKELRTPFYRIQLFERAGPPESGASNEGAPEPPEVMWARAAPLPPELAARFARPGRARKGGRPEALTYRLPILMYHQVAPSGARGFARYRVAPDAFEEQLRYLRDAGFRGVTLDEWREAMQR